jgi:protein-disulfide isomerase
MRERLTLYLILILSTTALAACGPASTTTPGLAEEGTDPGASVPLTLSSGSVIDEPLSSADDLATIPGTELLENYAPVVIVEYSDFQCPFCRRHFQATLPQLKAEYIDTGRVYYVFKDFPIASLHPMAYRLHEAALCAGNSDGAEAYWQSHDLFFEQAEIFQKNSQGAMDEAILSEFGISGLSVTAIKECLEDGRFTAEVKDYIAEGQTLGIRGTPSFFINGSLLVGAQPVEAFQAAISQAERGEVITAASPDPSPVLASAPTPAPIEPRTLTALGDPDAPVTIVEYSDYQCPFCRRHFSETMPLLKANFIDTGRVYYVFKDFPIESLHPLAYRLHEAALCAGEDGGPDSYWRAHDFFFAEAAAYQADSLAALDAAILTDFAVVGLPDIRECLESNKNASIVQTGIAEGLSLGVNGTPAFFINGYPISGAQPYALFEYAISLAEEGRLAEAYQPADPNDGTARATGTEQPSLPVDVPLGNAPAKGSPNAPITIVEYSDYQCPFCFRHFQQTMPQLLPYIDDGRVRYVFKDYPLHNIHPQAQKAHEAARCARELGGDDGFWKMHDLLFTNQDAWATVPVPGHVEVIKRLADATDLSPERFDDCVDSGRYADAVNNDVAEGVQLGINGTPTFFINGHRLVGAQPFSMFLQAITELAPGQ